MVSRMFKTLEKKSLAASVFEQLRDHIVAGHVDPGDALPAERVLAEQLGVNRQAVREGLKRLEQAGLVAIHQGGATRVLDYRETAGLELLATLIRSPTGINTTVVRSVVQMRSSLGPDVAATCARARGGATGPELQALVDQMRAGPELGVLQVLALDWWGVVVRGGGNVAYQLAYNSLDRTYRLVMQPLSKLVEAEVSATDDYAAATAAILAGDVEAASDAARRILAHSEASIGKLLDDIDVAQEGP